MQRSGAGTIPQDATGAATLGEADAYVEAHGVPDIVEVLLPDTSGVLRGKWLPGHALSKVW
ncbi:MAG: hypothetical protein B7Y12_05830, partial [Rhizobiales bacterium 24-66-13]